MKENKTKTILIIGTLDTKEDEILFIKKLINKRDFNAIIMDTGKKVLSNNIKSQLNTLEILI